MSCIEAMVVKGYNFVVYGRRPLKIDTAIIARKRRKTLRSQCGAGIPLDARLTDTSFDRCEQELFYCRMLQDAFDASM